MQDQPCQGRLDNIVTLNTHGSDTSEHISFLVFLETWYISRHALALTALALDAMCTCKATRFVTGGGHSNSPAWAGQTCRQSTAVAHLIGQVLQGLWINHSIQLAQPMLDGAADLLTTVCREQQGLVVMQTQPFQVRPVTTADSDQYEL